MNAVKTIVQVMFAINLGFFILFLWIPSHYYKIPQLRVITGGSAALLGLWLWWDPLVKSITTIQ